MRVLLLSLMLLMLVLPHCAISEEQQEKEAWMIDPFWPEIDENNPPKCGGPEDYYFPYMGGETVSTSFKGLHQCFAIFLKKLQTALRNDDKKSIYKMLAKDCLWRRCRNLNQDTCRDGGSIRATEDLEYSILFKTEQDFMHNYHLIFRDEIKSAILQASVYNLVLGGSFSQPTSEEPFIGLYMNLLWMNHDFTIASINNVWSREGCFVP